MKTSQKNKPESGQVLILMVTAMVALMGFLALAIDGGIVYSDRRIAQNAADTAALTGVGAIANNWGDAYEDCGNAKTDGVSAAQNNLVTNDFSSDSNPNNQTSVTAECQNTPFGKIYYIDVDVTIKHQTQTALVHFVYSGDMINTVEATGRVYPSKPVGEGNSIISLTDECQGDQKGTVFGGGIEVSISKGGGIFSNSCLVLNGSSGSVDVKDGGTISYYNDGGYTNNGMTVNPPPQDVDAKNKPEVDKPDCSIYSTEKPNPGNAGGDITPGLFDKIKVTASNATLNLDPGLYCVDGVFEFSGQHLNAYGVTIAMIGTGGFHSSGGAEVHLEAPPADCGGPCPGNAIEGLLLYVVPGLQQDVDLMGNSLSTFSGTVYAPENQVKIGGTPALADPSCTDPTDPACAVAYTTQLIGSTVKVGGTANIDIVYEEGKFAHTHSILEMAR